MTSNSQTKSESELAILKLKNNLDQLSERIGSSSDASVILSEAMSSFRSFFDQLSNPEFVPEEFSTGDTARSSLYNSNFKSIYNDLFRFYKELDNLNNANIKAFNYSQVVINEIKKRAESLSSIVLDLNILNNLTRGDVIVAGDDFNDSSNIDSSAALGAPAAELVSNGSGLSLSRNGSNTLTSDSKIKIDIIPISPTSSSSENSVTTKPTPGNFKRFYEGNYYNFLGLARPEGGKFNIQYILDTNKLEQDPEKDPSSAGVFLEIGASEEVKRKARSKMVDGNPDTFWECEYVIKIPNPLITDLENSIVYDEQAETPPEGENTFSDPESPTGGSIQIDTNLLNDKAALEDVEDLIVDLVITFPQEQSVNFVYINPVTFSKNAFLDIVDISTADEATGVFTTVDGWDSIRFPKSLTPEANEYLTDSQATALLSPSRSNYLGQGVFPFPVRIAKKIKIRIASTIPVAQVYERTYALLRNTLDLDITTTTTTKRGALRF